MTTVPQGAAMEFRVLGALEVRRGEDLVAVGSRKERTLLTALLVNSNAVVSSDRLIDVLWDGKPPPSDRNSLQTYVARLRRRLAGASPGPGDAPILTRPPGYVLEVDADQIDALRFEALLEEARSALGADPLRRCASSRRPWGCGGGGPSPSSLTTRWPGSRPSV